MKKGKFAVSPDCRKGRRKIIHKNKKIKGEEFNQTKALWENPFKKKLKWKNKPE